METQKKGCREQGGYERTPSHCDRTGKGQCSWLGSEYPVSSMACRKAFLGDFLETVIKGTGFARNLSYSNPGARIREENDLPKATQLSNWAPRATGDACIGSPCSPGWPQTCCDTGNDLNLETFVGMGALERVRHLHPPSRSLDFLFVKWIGPLLSLSEAGVCGENEGQVFSEL